MLSMRFLILTLYYPPEVGAPQVRLQAIVRELRRSGHEVEVVTALPNYPNGTILSEYRGRFYIREEIDSVVVHRVWLYAAMGSGLRRILNYVTFTVACLWGLWHSQRPDYIFVESPPLLLSIPGYLAARLFKTKMIFNVADLWPDVARELGLIKEGWLLRVAFRLERWSYRVAFKVSAVTEGIRSALIKKGVPEAKVLFLPNGVDTEMFKPGPADLLMAQHLGLQGQKVILYAGTLGYVHGLETALRAARSLSNRPDIKFLFVGNGSEKEKLLKISHSNNLRNVQFLDPGPPDFVARLYSLSVAGLVVLRNVRTRSDFRSSKILPALAAGVPVVHSGNGEGARLVEQAQAGLITPPENPQALADAVVRLVDNPEWAKSLGHNGRQYAEEHLIWSKLLKKWTAQLAA